MLHRETDTSLHALHISGARRMEVKIAALSLCLLLCACGGGEDPDKSRDCELRTMPNGELVCVFHS